MRLWSLAPALLDRAALVAGWREGLLAQKVLQGGTKGYRHHPQLERFRNGDDPLALVAAYLDGLAAEATARGYRFNTALIGSTPAAPGSLEVTTGQLALEFAHLRAKVRIRDADWLPHLVAPAAHQLFLVVDGPIATWERTEPPVQPSHPAQPAASSRKPTGGA